MPEVAERGLSVRWRTTLAATAMGLIPPLAGTLSRGGTVGYLAQDALHIAGIADTILKLIDNFPFICGFLQRCMNYAIPGFFDGGGKCAVEERFIGGGGGGGWLLARS